MARFSAASRPGPAGPGMCRRMTAALVVALGLGTAGPAFATERPLLHLDASAGALREGLSPAPGGAAWSASADALGAACAAQPAGAVRFALLSGRVPRLRAEACRRGADAEVLVLSLGREALVMAVPAGRPVPRLDADGIFRAFGANAPRGEAQAAPASLLAPPAGGAVAELFSAMVMEAGCVASLPAGNLPHDPAARAAFCGALRDGAATRRRAGSAAEGVAQLRAWAAAAPQGAVAAIGLGEWLELTGVVDPAPLDGTLPTVANLAAGLYPAAREVQLVVVLPRAATAQARATALDIGFALIGEGTIGPMGSLAARGVTALPAAERVDARLRLTEFLETR